MAQENTIKLDHEVNNGQFTVESMKRKSHKFAGRSARIFYRAWLKFTNSIYNNEMRRRLMLTDRQEAMKNTYPTKTQ